MRWFVRAGHGESEGVRERREAGKSEERKAVAWETRFWEAKDAGERRYVETQSERKWLWGSEKRRSMRG